MEVVSYTFARSKFAKIMNKVCDDHSPVMVTRQENDPVVIMSLDDYNSIKETLYLLGTNANAQKLEESINDFRERKNYTAVDIK